MKSVVCKTNKLQSISKEIEKLQVVFSLTCASYFLFVKRIITWHIKHSTETQRQPQYSFPKTFGDPRNEDKNPKCYLPSFILHPWPFCLAVLHYQNSESYYYYAAKQRERSCGKLETGVCVKIAKMSMPRWINAWYRPMFGFCINRIKCAQLVTSMYYNDGHMNNFRIVQYCICVE